MSQKLPLNSLKWKKDMSRFNKEFIKHYHEYSNKGYILVVDVKYPKKNMVCMRIYHSYPKE